MTFKNFGSLLMAFAFAAIMMMCETAYAAPIVTTYDTTLGAPGFYNGTGGVDGNFTVGTSGNLQLGLRASLRFVGPVDPGLGSNIYIVPTGTVGGKAKWNFDLSAFTQAGGGSATLGQYAYTLNVTDLTNSNIGPTFDWVRLIADNSGYGSAGKTAGVNLATEWGAQNSENLSFLGFLPGFDPNAAHVYQITSNAYSGGQLVDTATIFVSAQTPEPSSFILGGLGLVALGFFRRRLRA